MADDDRLYAAATVRNRDPIATALQDCLPSTGTVLEVASGTGEHACFFASRFKKLTWQPSDPDENLRRSIAAWRTKWGINNVLPPLDIDAARWPWPIAHADALVNINMVHIAPFSACEGLMRGAAKTLTRGGLLYMYGPFWVDGVQPAPSNVAFDEALRLQDPAWGVRELRDVAALANRVGLVMRGPQAMPANNFSVVFDRI